MHSIPHARKTCDGYPCTVHKRCRRNLPPKKLAPPTKARPVAKAGINDVCFCYSRDMYTRYGGCPVHGFPEHVPVFNEEDELAPPDFEFGQLTTNEEMASEEEINELLEDALREVDAAFPLGLFSVNSDRVLARFQFGETRGWQMLECKEDAIVDMIELPYPSPEDIGLPVGGVEDMSLVDLFEATDPGLFVSDSDSHTY